MADEQDSWLSSTLGIDASSYLGDEGKGAASADLGGATADAEAPVTTGNVRAEDEIPSIPGETAIDQVEVEGQEDKPVDDGSNEGKQDNGDSSSVQITATLENDEIIIPIVLTVDDMIASKTILFQQPVKGGAKVTITLQTDNFGVGKIEWLTQQVDSPNTIKRNIVDNVHDGDNIHLFLQ